MKKVFTKKLYETLSHEDGLDPLCPEDCDKMKIVDDILNALKRTKKFDPSFVNSMKEKWKYSGEITSDQYNSLVKIYYAWRVEERLASRFEVPKVEEDINRE